MTRAEGAVTRRERRDRDREERRQNSMRSGLGSGPAQRPHRSGVRRWCCSPPAPWLSVSPSSPLGWLSLDRRLSLTSSRAPISRVPVELVDGRSIGLGHCAGDGRDLVRLPVPGLPPPCRRTSSPRSSRRSSPMARRDWSIAMQPSRAGAVQPCLRRIGRGGSRRPVCRRPGTVLADARLDLRQLERRERGRLRQGSTPRHRPERRPGRRRVRRMPRNRPATGGCAKRDPAGSRSRHRLRRRR